MLGDTAKIEGALKNVGAAGESSASRIGSAFASIGKGAAIGLAGLAAVAAALIAKGVMADAAAEQMRNSLETVTGSVARANELFTELQQFAAATPFEFPELVQASINLEAFGLKTEDWINTVGDTASAMGKSVDQVTQAVLDAATGQYERLKELGISAGVEGDKLVIRYMKNGKQITESVDKTNKDIILKTIQGIWNDKYKGAMIKQSKTFLGQWSTLKDNFNMTLQKMAMPFFDFTKKILAEGNQFFNLFNKKMAAGLDPVHAALSALHVTLDQVFGKQAGDLIDGTLRGIVDGIGSMIGAVQTVIGVLSAMGGALSADLLKGDIAGFFIDLRDDFEFLASKGLDLGVIAVKAIFKLGEGVVSDIWNWFLGQLGFGGGSPTNPITGFGNTDFGAINPTAGRPVDLGNIFVTATLALADGILAGAGSLWDWFQSQIGVTAGGKFLGKGDGTEQQAPISLGDVTVSVAGILLDVAEGAISWAVGVAERVAAWAKGSGWDATVNLTALTIDAFLSGMSWAAGVADRALAWVKSSGWDAVVNLTTLAIDLGSSALSWAEGVADTVKTWIDGDRTLMTGDVTATMSGTKIVVDIGDNVTVDWSALSALIFPSTEGINGIFVSEDWSQKAQEFGYGVGKKVGELIVKAVEFGLLLPILIPKSFFDQMTGGKKGQDPLVQAIGQALLATIVGIVTGIGTQLYDDITGLDVTKYLGKAYDAVAGILGKVWDFLGKAFADPLAVGGQPSGASGDPRNIGGGGPLPASGGGSSVIADMMMSSIVTPIVDAIKAIPGKVTDALSGIPNPFDGIVTWVKEKFAAVKTFFGGAASTEPGAGTQTIPDPTNWSSTVYDHTAKPIVDALTGLADKVTGALSGLTSPFDSIVSTVKGWVDGIQWPDPPAIPDWIKDPLGWIRDQIASFLGGGSGESGGGGATGFRNTNQKSGSVLGDIQKGFQGGGGGGFNLDFTATFTADTQGVSDGFQMARAIGQAWDISVFPAAFTADIANVQDQANFAWSIGNQWAGQVFTASFAIDTSGLQAASDAADAVAAHIAAVMPHSPAREGPLREPISFDYIADSMRSAMSRVASYAGAGAAAVAGIGGYIPLGTTGTGYSYVSRTGHGRHGTALQGGDTYIIQGDVLSHPDWERKVRELVASGAVKVVGNTSSAYRLAGRS